jgi:hypothetical protein
MTIYRTPLGTMGLRGVRDMHSAGSSLAGSGTLRRLGWVDMGENCSLQLVLMDSRALTVRVGASEENKGAVLAYRIY